MTYEELQKANATIRTTDVRGKEYAEVNQRVRAFRMLYPEGAIVTTMLSNDGEAGKRTCVFRTEVYDSEGKLLSTGTAYENEGSTNINRTSYLENCETSAVGRALGFLGLGVDVAIASAEEVKNAIAAQTPAQSAQDAPRAQEAAQADRITSKDAKALVDATVASGVSLTSLLNFYGVRSEGDLTQEQYNDALARLAKFAPRQKKEG